MFQQDTFAGAAFADDRGNFALVDAEIDAVQNDVVPKPFGGILSLLPFFHRPVHQ